jgi:hypothetical protein
VSELTVQIPVEKLREVFDTLLKHVEQDSDHISVHSDAFWSIPAPSVYDVYSEPRDLTIGSISDSWRNLEEMTQADAGVVAYGMAWLAEVLRAVGDEFPL